MKIQSLNKLLEMKKRLNKHADRLNLSYRCEFNFLAFEDDFVHVNIESRNTHKMSYRVSDSRFVREGRELQGPGQSIPSAYKTVLSELRAHSKAIALNKAATEQNCVVFRGELVVCENFESKQWSARCAYKLINSDGSFSNWFGFSAEDALKNASPWLKQTPVLIQLTEERGA